MSRAGAAPEDLDSSKSALDCSEIFSGDLDGAECFGPILRYIRLKKIRNFLGNFLAY